MSAKDGFRLVRRPLGWRLTPADVLRLVREDAHPVALSGTWAGGSDVVAAEPVLVRSAPGPLGDVLDAPWPAGAGDRPPHSARTAHPAGTARSAAGGSATSGTARAARRCPRPGRGALPAWWFGYYDHVLRRMRASGEWYFEALCTPGRADALDRRLAELTRRAAARARAARATTRSARSAWCPGPSGTRRRSAGRWSTSTAVTSSRPTSRLRAEADFAGDPLDAFCRGVTELDPPYAAFIGVSAPGAARAAVASLSPELFLRRAGGSRRVQADQGHRAPRRRRRPGRRAARRA